MIRNLKILCVLHPLFCIFHHSVHYLFIYFLSLILIWTSYFNLSPILTWIETLFQFLKRKTVSKQTSVSLERAVKAAVNEGSFAFNFWFRLSFPLFRGNFQRRLCFRSPYASAFRLSNLSLAEVPRFANEIPPWTSLTNTAILLEEGDSRSEMPAGRTFPSHV